MNKRIFSFLLCICFLFSCVNTAVFADAILQAENLTVDGPEMLLKPMDGTYSKVRYKLLDDASNEISGVKWSVNSDGLLLDTNGNAVLWGETVNGSYTVTAEYNGSFYSKKVSVTNGVYENYNSGTVGGNYTTGTRSSTYYAKDGDESDLYVSPDNGFYYLETFSSDVGRATQDVTLEYDIMTDKTGNQGFVGHVQSSCREWAGNLEAKNNNSKYTFIILDYTNYFINGNKPNTRTYDSDIDAGTWVTITMKMKNQGLDEDGKLKDHKWDIYANDELIFSDIMMRCIGYIRNDKSLITDCTGILSLYSYGTNDNVGIYSGDKFDPETDPYFGLKIDGAAKLGKPRTSEAVTSSYTLKNFLNNEVSCTWSISPENDGVSISSDGTVSVTKDAKIGDYEITAQYSGGKETAALTVEDVEYVMSITGPDSVSIDYGFTEKTFDYTAADQFGIGEDCSWTVSGDGEFVTVEDGTLTVKKGAEDGTYKIIATPKDENSSLSAAEFDVEIKTLKYELAIDGADKILVKSDSDVKKEAYTAKIICTDDSSVALVPDSSKVTWSVSSEDENVKIENGTLTVGGAANKCTYTVSAEYDGFIASKDVTVEGIVYSISGGASVIRPASGLVSAVQYSLVNNFGETVTDGVEWSCDNAEILTDGRVLLTPSTGSYTVSAEYAGSTYKLNAAVSAGTTFDYESYEVGDYIYPSKTYGEILRADEKSNKSKYFYASYTDSAHRMYLGSMGLSGDDVTLSYDCFAEPGESFSNAPTICDIDWIESTYYKCDSVGGKFVYTFTVENYNAEQASGTPSFSKPKYTLTLDENDWVHVDIVFNTVEDCFDMYINGNKAFENIRMRFWDQREFHINNILLVGRLDNVASHSGRIYDRKITYAGTNSMPIASEGESRKTLRYEITDEGKVNEDLKADWEIKGFGDDFTGDKSAVSVQRNELVAASPVYGTVYVKATVKGMPTNTGDIAIKLVPSFSQMNSDSSSLGAKGASGDEFTVDIYYPNGKNYVNAAIGYSDKASKTEKITADSDGNAKLDITYPTDGMYYVTITDKNGTVEEYVICKNCDKLFAQSDLKILLTDENINKYFALYTDKDSALISECSSVYAQLADDVKDKAIKFTNGNIDNYFVSVLLASVLSGDASYASDCASKLKAIGYDPSAVDLMVKSKHYADIAAAVMSGSSDTIASALENINAETILIGVEKYDISYKEVKPYLERAGSSKYNNASDEDKNIIAKAVAGNKYSSLTKLIEAINAVDISKGGSGGGGGSSFGGNKTSGGTIGSYIPTPTPDTKNRFTDVSKSHWAFEYIENLASKNIINGYNDYFYPDNVITRAEFVKILVSAFGIEKASGSSFTDVSDSDWFMPYVGGAANAGLVLGSDGKFNPNDSITREDACVMIHRFAKYAGINIPGANVADFADGNDVSAYASEAVNALASSEIINGVGGGMFAPKASTTRAAAAKIIYLLLSRGGIA